MDVELSTCQIVRDGVLNIVDVCYPVVTADIRYIKQVKDVHSDCDILEVSPEVIGAYAVCRCSDKLIAQPDVKSLISRSAKVGD